MHLNGLRLGGVLTGRVFSFTSSLIAEILEFANAAFCAAPDSIEWIQISAPVGVCVTEPDGAIGAGRCLQLGGT